MAFFIGVALFGLALLIGPVMASSMGVQLPGTVVLILSGVGLFTFLFAAIAVIVTKLYVRTKASEAFVRTGMGGRVVIKDGGAIVFPVVHEIVSVSLETLRLKVVRRGPEALLTKDKLRADIEGEFFVRVMPNDEDIINAARSLGEKTGDEETIKKLIEDKLVRALRTAAAIRSLEELNTERDKFVKDVMSLVSDDLKHNGFTLETVTISSLDQAPASALKDDNIFDAQGKRTIAEITQAQWTQRNLIERTAEQERMRQDVDARQKVLELERMKSEAEANQASSIARIRSEATRASEEARQEAERKIAESKLNQENAIALLSQQTQREQSIASQEREKAIAVAVQQRQQAEELAKRTREIAVAEQESLLAQAEQKRLSSEKAKEQEAQSIETVKVTAAAERSQAQEVIAAKAQAEKVYVQQTKQADGDAYAVQKAAEARKLSAEAEALAIRQRAEADSEAAKRRADGDQAGAMIPIAVRAREVEIEQKRVEVLKQELEAREKSGRVAQEFELSKLRIEAETTVRVEMAKAAASFGSKIETTLYGTPEDLAKMQTAFLDGMKWSKVAEGFVEGAGDHTLAVAAQVGQAAGELAGAAAERLKGPSKKA